MKWFKVTGKKTKLKEQGTEISTSAFCSLYIICLRGNAPLTQPLVALGISPMRCMYWPRLRRRNWLHLTRVLSYTCLSYWQTWSFELHSVVHKLMNCVSYITPRPLWMSLIQDKRVRNFWNPVNILFTVLLIQTIHFISGLCSWFPVHFYASVCSVSW